MGEDVQVEPGKKRVFGPGGEEKEDKKPSIHVAEASRREEQENAHKQKTKDKFDQCTTQKLHKQASFVKFR